MTDATLTMDPIEAKHAAPPEPAPAPDGTTFAAWLLSPSDAREAPDVRREAARLGAGLGLAALFGASLGLRVGGASIAQHALGATAGLVAVAAVAAPAFSVVLALLDAPTDSVALARSTASAIARAGLVLGGLAPAAALYVLTVEDGVTATGTAVVGFVLSGLIAGSSLSRDLRAQAAAGSAAAQRWLRVAVPLFLVFAAMLAWRVWWLALPILRGTR